MMRRNQSGYVLLVVLLLAALIVSTIAAYARHASTDWRESTASLWVHQTRESASSGVAYARQVLASGGACGSTRLTAGDKSVSVDIADAGGSSRTLRVDATDGQLGSTVLANAKVYGLSGNVLPSLSSAGSRAVSADPQLVTLSGRQTLTAQNFAGSLVLADGADITLDDVVVAGAIVSAPALAGPPYAPATATRLTLRNGVRVGPSSVIAGCAIVIPDGTLMVQAGASIEIHGAVVANSLDVQGTGAMDAQVVAARSFTLPAGIDRPGVGRAPLAWPAALVTSSWGISSIAFPRQVPDSSAIQAISGYRFPAVARR